MGKFNNTRSITDFQSLPLYANRRNWARILGISYAAMQIGMWSGKLKGDKVGQNWYYTRQQILAWFAPSLYREIYHLDPNDIEGTVYEGDKRE